MKYTFVIILLLILSCKETNNKQIVEVDIETTETPEEFEELSEEKENLVVLPEGAVDAYFSGKEDVFYAYVKNVNLKTQTTYIHFENEKLPQLSIPESIGANLQALKLKNFDRNLLLVNAKLKDTNFNEYYLYFWNDSIWKQAVNRFNIHKSNMNDTITPITNNPKDSTQLLRYYSVFDLDKTGVKKYSWILLQESVPIEF